ncbi:MAG TPA: protein-disulfide reductase DsbD domain-containing protein [Xanthobacteraceae bacterium]|nr:protein-disulfide reductase DsbD domain-containing protein [Xanthobacteraceae bacterium]
MRNLTIRRIIIAIVAVSCFGRVSVARAQDASAWDGQFHAAARLIAGAAGQTADTKWLRAGIEIRLDPGWKTYWRYPGDSGVPPTFDFTGSENVQSITTLWPAPERFADGAGGQSIGYFGDVVLPLHVVPKDASKPSLLRVKVGYAVCGNLCVPAQAQLDLTLSGRAGAEESMLVAAEDRVPRPIRLGSHDQAGHRLSVQSVHREVDGAHARVVVEVAASEGEPVDLFAEGPTPDWALPLPEPTKPTGSAPALRRFIFDLDGLPPGAKADGAMLRLTAISPTDAIEVEASLD